MDDGPAAAQAQPDVVGNGDAHQQNQQQQQQVEVVVSVANISRKGLQQLEQLLGQWASWHKANEPQGCLPGMQLLRGRLALDVHRLYSDGVVDWQDSVGAVPGSGAAQQFSTCSYEQVEAPPLYDRAVDELLAPAPTQQQGGVVWAGSAAAARRRQQAEACLSPAGGAGASDAPAKRRRLPAQRCYNCGSYAHGLSDCFKPLDQARVSAARTAAQASRGGPSGGNLLKRYFTADAAAAGGDKAGGGGGKAGPPQYQGLKPGSITPALAKALGMSDPLAPPPWTSRMAALGVPPRYAATEGGPSRLAGDDVMAFISDSDDGGGDGDEDSGASGDAADADFVPLGADGQAAADGGQQQQQQQDGEEPEAQESVAAAAAAAWAAHVLQDTGPAATSSGRRRRRRAKKTQHQLLQGQQAWAPSRPATVTFAGINGPPPAGADAAAWQAEVDKGLLMARMLEA